jgi:hypothetical protein
MKGQIYRNLTIIVTRCSSFSSLTFTIIYDLTQRRKGAKIKFWQLLNPHSLAFLAALRENKNGS